MFFSTYFLIKHSNNLFYFSICLPRVLECLGLLIVVFRLFKSSVEAPYNVYTSRIPKRAHKIRDGNPSSQAGSGRPEGFHRTTGRWKGGLEFWSFQPFQFSFLHLFKGGVFSISRYEFASEKQAQNSAILFSKVSKHTCNPLESK